MTSSKTIRWLIVIVIRWIFVVLLIKQPSNIGHLVVCVSKNANRKMCPIRLLLISIFSSVALIGTFFLLRDGVTTHSTGGTTRPGRDRSLWAYVSQAVSWKPKMRPGISLALGASLILLHLYIFDLHKQVMALMAPVG